MLATRQLNPTMLAAIQLYAVMALSSDRPECRIVNDYKTSLFHQHRFQMAMMDGEDIDNLESGEASNEGATDNTDDLSDQEQDQMATMADHDHVKNADRM